jgi:hypothetical protein
MGGKKGKIMRLIMHVIISNEVKKTKQKNYCTCVSVNPTHPIE